MSDTRTLATIVAALEAHSAALADLIATSDAQVVPVNVHTATSIVSSFATDAAAFADLVSSTPAGTDQALTDRVTHVELILTEAGLMAAAAPAAPAVQAPAPAPAADTTAAPAPAPAV